MSTLMLDRRAFVDDEDARRASASVAGTISRPWELWKKKALAR